MENPTQVRIVPKLDHYVVEVIYERISLDLSGSTLIAAIDLGINNLAAVTFNQPGLEPLLINGRPLKSINQFYNQQLAKLQSILGDEKRTSLRIKRLATKRNHKVDNYLHSCSRWLINESARIGVGTLIIGKNEGWKQESNIGKRNNQNFVSIPHSRFISQLEYKGRLAGIRVIVTEESYTSKQQLSRPRSNPDKRSQHTKA